MSYTVRIPLTAKADVVDAIKAARPIVDEDDTLHDGQFAALVAALPSLIEVVGGPADRVEVEVIGHAAPDDDEEHQADEVVSIVIRGARSTVPADA